MWLSVDRIEESLSDPIVVLVADDEKIYRLTSPAYTALTGRSPAVNDMLDGQIENGVIVSATCSDEETERRLAEARAWMERMKKRSRST